MNKTALLALSGLVCGWAGVAAAQDIACGTTYVVSPGDTLSAISNRAYGVPGEYPTIYRVNSGTIGPNPGIIEIGMVLDIPCLDGAVPASTADNSVIRREATTELLPAPEDRQIRIVTASDWAPYLNEDQEQGGMITEIVNVSMQKVTEEGGYKIDFINDWGAHLQPLISDSAYDMSLAWFRPNCDVVERLAEGSQFRCNNLDWSDPLYEEIIGFYTRADYPTPLSHSDMFGTTICRPAGYSTFMMEEHNLMPPNITLVQPNSPSDCFRQLADGAVDGVVLSVDVSDDAIRSLGVQPQVKHIDTLDSVATLHAVTSKNNPNGLAYLAVLNDGLNQLKESGEWFSIVRRHLAEHKAKQ